MSKFFRVILCLSLLVHLSIQGQVTIGSNKEPISGALLMLDDGHVGMLNENSKKGLGLPRVELQNYSSLQMGSVHNEGLEGKELDHIGLLVYNIADEVNRCDDNVPTSGLYVWDGEQWQAINGEPHFVPSTGAPGPSIVYAPNCYIVTSGGSVTIPVEKAFAIWDWWGGGKHPEGKILDETSEAFTGSLSVAVLWQETEEAVSIGNPIVESVSFDSSINSTSTALDRTAKIYIKIKDNAVGNAVVTLKDGTGQVRWSWHIWVPKDDPTITTYTHNAGKQTNTFMDRNIGASRSGVLETDRNYTIGLGYQWGRKDPFPDYVKLDGTKTTITINTSNTLAGIQTSNGDGELTGLKYAINNPLGFIKNTSGVRDWYSTASEKWDSRWGYVVNECSDIYTYKSEMDPCPEGWRMPSYVGADDADSPWAKDGVSSTDAIYYTDFKYDKGFYFTNTDYNIGWYPAAGFRNYNALTYDFGIHGDYWSASPNGSNSRYYNVNRGNSTTLKNGQVRSYSLERAYSFSVRCVKE